MDTKLVTLIIPVYNVEDYLCHCVDSVIAQSYKNIEIILVDDGSTDDSGSICERYKGIDERIKVIHKSNGGLSDARNVGMRVALGELITFIDSDDVVDCNFIQYLVQLLESVNADISVCQYRKIDEEGKFIGHQEKSEDFVVEGNDECMHEFFSNTKIGTVAWGKLYKKSLFADICYPVGKYHEDVYTTYKLIAKSNKIIVGGAPKYYYRQRQNSIVNQNFSVKHLDAVNANIERSCFILEHYPNLYDYACMGIVYASNQCVFKIIRSKGKYNDEVKYLQTQYKKYYKSYLKYASSFFAKIFVRLAHINLSMLIVLCKPFKKKFK